MAEANSFQFIRPNQGRRIDARPRNVEYEEGTGPGTGRTARRVDPGMGGGLNAFYMSQRYKDLPMSMINREANIRRDQGMMYNPYTGTYQRDSMYNRSGFGFGREPVGDMQPQAPAMTEPQQEWARLAQEKQSGAGALGKIGEKMANVNVNPMFGAGLQAIGTAMNGALKPSFTANPYAGTRSQNIANAKAAGMFDKIRDEFNKQNDRPGGSWMSEEGSIYTTDAKGEIDYDALKKHGFSWKKTDDSYDLYEGSAPRDWRQIQNPASKIVRNPEEFAKTKAEERALQRGSFVTPQTLSKEDEAAGVKSRVAIENPYGRGSFTRYTDPSKKPPSMVKDDFGNWIPMNQYLERKNYVQGTQGMTGGTSVLGGNRPAASVLPANPLRKDEGRNLFPNAIDEKAQFDDFRGKLSEAKKRGEEGMAKARGGKAATDLKPLTPSEQRKLTMLEAKYGAQGFASDEMKAIDAERASLYRVLKNLQEEINAGEEMIRPAGGQDPTGFMFGRPLSGKAVSRPLSPQELAARANKVEEITRLIQENEAKSQELGNKRKIPEEAMKEWLELSARANAS